MIKNLIILFLIYIIGVLLFASSSNVDLLKQKAVEAKEFIWKAGVSGVNYVDDLTGKETLTEDSFFKEEEDNGEKNRAVSKNNFEKLMH